MKNRIALLLVVGAIHCAPAFAQSSRSLSAPAEVAAKELLTAMNYREMTLNLLNQFEEAMPDNMRTVIANKVNGDPGMTALQKTRALAKFEAEMPRFREEMHDFFSDPEMVDDMFSSMAKAYAGMYTIAELQQLNEFYRSPLGRKVLANIPRMATVGMQVGTRLVARRMDKFVAEEVQRIVGQ